MSTRFSNAIYVTNAYNNIELERNNNNNYNGQYYGQYFVGPYCDGKAIHLGVFYNEQCTARAPTSIYSDMNYGKALPYSKESMVGSECISCMDQQNDDQNNNNNNQNGEANQLCEEMYEQSVRCETSMDIYTKDTSGCEYINKQLPNLVNASRNIRGSNRTAKAFAWIFALTTLFFGAYAYYLIRKIKNGKVTLVDHY